MIFADTSFVLSFLLSDDHTERAIAHAEDLDQPIIICPLTKLEFLSTLGRQQKGWVISGEQHREALALFEEKIALGQFQMGLVDHVVVWQRAYELAVSYATDIGSRSLDVWHVAFALEAGADCLWSFDARQCQLAEQCGMRML